MCTVRTTTDPLDAGLLQLFCAPHPYGHVGVVGRDLVWAADESGHCTLCGRALPCSAHGNTFRDTPGPYKVPPGERRQRQQRRQRYEAAQARKATR